MPVRKTDANHADTVSDYEFVKNVLTHFAKNDVIDHASYERLRREGAVELASRILANPAYIALTLAAMGVMMMNVIPVFLRLLPPQFDAGDFLFVSSETPDQSLFALLFYTVLAIPIILMNQMSLHSLHERKGSRMPLLGGYFDAQARAQEHEGAIRDFDENASGQDYETMARFNLFFDRLSVGNVWGMVIVIIYGISLVGILEDLPAHAILPMAVVSAISAGIHLWSRWSSKYWVGRTAGLLLVSAIPIVLYHAFSASVQANSFLRLTTTLVLVYNLLYLLVSGMWVVIEWFSHVKLAKGDGDKKESQRLRIWIWDDLMPVLVVTGLVFIYCLVAPAINSALVPDSSPIPVEVELWVKENNGEIVEWGKMAYAKPKDTIDFQIRFNSSETSSVQNARISVALPDELEYEQGTAKVFSAQDANGEECDGLFSDEGADIGSYAAGEYSYVRFKASVKDSTRPGCLSVFVRIPNNESRCVADIKDVSIYVSAPEQTV